MVHRAHLWANQDIAGLFGRIVDHELALGGVPSMGVPQWFIVVNAG